MKKPLIRWAWLLVLIAQIALYSMSYSHLAAIEAKHGWPGGVTLNTVLLDFMGAFFWCGALVFFEEKPFPKWLRYPLVVLFALGTLAVVRLNLSALIGA